MAINENLTNRVREALAGIPDVEEKKMFRGITFMVNGKMCISVGNDELMCRIDPELHDKAVEMNGVRPVFMKGREYRGYVNVHEDAVKRKKDLDYWVGICLAYNPHAKATAKKSKK